jgi:ABC-2 type transport system ATP-binding protein
MSALLEVSGLTKYYGRRPAVQNVTFSADRGQVIGLLGLNGAGKSTIMNIIAGCLSLSSGTVLVDGFSVEDEGAKAKRRIGCLPEVPPLYMDMKVDEYLSFVRALKAGSPKGRSGHKKHDAQELEGIMAKTGLLKENLAKNLIRNLSKGCRQRVGLAASLIGDPPLLILDEPTAGLDVQQIMEIRGLIKDLGKAHAVLLSSHILAEVEAVCDRVIIIHEGVVAADGSVTDLAKSLPGNECLSLEDSFLKVVAGK